MTAWQSQLSTPAKSTAVPPRRAAMVPPPPRRLPRPLTLVVVKTDRVAKVPEKESPWHRIRIATTGSIRHIHDWLDDHCEGRWHVGLTGVDKYLATKFAEVHFEQATDKQRFKAMFAARQAMAA